MKAKELYRKLDGDFITDKMSDEWFEYMGEVEEFVCDNFKERSMGLVCDFADEITEVYSAVFPSSKVMEYILEQDVENALLFTHHPSIWDITKTQAFYQMDRDLLEKFRDRKISIYNLHVPLDAYGEYSTSVTLAKALGLTLEKPFAKYFGIFAGVIGTTDVSAVQDLQQIFRETVGHDVKLYNYGDDKIKDNRVAVVAGGGNDMDVAQEVAKENINVIVTGVSVKNEFSANTHDFEEKNNINLIGGTHYSTEKFACMEMCKYFEKLGLKVKFIQEKPMLEDL